MINLKVLSTAAILAIVLPVAGSSASYAQTPHPAGPRMGGGAIAAARGGAGPRMGGGIGGAGPRFQGGIGGGPRFGGGGPQFSGGGQRFDGGYRRGGGGFIPGAVAGAVIGGAIASQGYYGNSYAYYGNDGYDGAGPYAAQYDDGGGVVEDAAPAGGDDGVTCAQTYRSYDPSSGTYLGYDGARHSCP